MKDDRPDLRPEAGDPNVSKFDPNDDWLRGRKAGPAWSEITGRHARNTQMNCDAKKKRRKHFVHPHDGGELIRRLK